MKIHSEYVEEPKKEVTTALAEIARLKKLQLVHSLVQKDLNLSKLQFLCLRVVGFNFQQA